MHKRDRSCEDLAKLVHTLLKGWVEWVDPIGHLYLIFKLFFLILSTLIADLSASDQDAETFWAALLPEAAHSHAFHS